MLRWRSSSWRSSNWAWPFFGSAATDSQTLNPKVCIHAKPQLSDNVEQSLKWTVTVSVDGSEAPAIFTLQDVATPIIKDEVQWYLEQYAQQDPFAISRARGAYKALAQYAKSLAEQIQLGQIISPLLTKTNSGETSRPVEIEVTEEEVDPALSNRTVHQLHWETLEDTSQWLPNARVLVRRTVLQTNTDITPVQRMSPENASDGSMSKLNLLVVVARDLSQTPSSYQDVTPSLASGILSRLGEKISQVSKSVRLNIEIVRPGTLEALEMHLERKSQAYAPGYFQIIHFDLHGTVRKSKGVKTAFLAFASPTSDRTVLVSASSVANLLQKHKIPFAVLNSCESARANAGDDANIAKIFQNAGCGGVLAMSFKVSSHAAETFLTSFYGGLLLQELSFSQAAYEARKVLRDDLARPSRFGLQREVLDWFVPVCYVRGGDIIFAPERARNSLMGPEVSVPLDTAPRSLDQTARENRRLFGREFALLRLEKLLIKKMTVYVHGIFGVGKTAFLKHAENIWTSTSFVDAVIYIDLASSNTESAGEIAKIVLSSIHESEETKGSKKSVKGDFQPTFPDDETAIFQCLRKVLQKLHILIIFDRLQDSFSIVNRDIVRNTSKNAETSLSTFLSNIDQSNGKGASYSIPYLIFTGRKNLKWLTSHIDIPFSIATFELPALQMSDALDLAQSLLIRSGGEHNDLTRSTLDQLESIVELFQNNPGTMCDVLPHLNTAGIVPEHRYEYLRECSFINFFEKMENDSTLNTGFSEIHRLYSPIKDRSLAILIILSLYWHEASRVGSIYDMILSAGICTDTEPFGTVIELLTERGYITLGDGIPHIVWIHPLFTFCLRSVATLLEAAHRQKISESVSISSDDGISDSLPLALKAAHLVNGLLSEIPSPEKSSLSEVETSSFRGKFLEGLEMQWSWKLLVATTSGIDVKDMSDFYFRGLLNTLTCIGIITANISDVPLQDWPHTVFERFSTHIKVVGTATQKKLTARHFEKLLKSLVSCYGYAIDPELFHRTQNLSNYLVWSHLVGGLSDSSSQRSQELHRLSLDILKASEEKYGTITEGPALYEKAYTIRLEAMLRLVEGKYTEALDTWKRFMVLDNLWAQFIEKQSQINRQQDTINQLARFGDAFISHEARDKKQAAEMHQRLQAALQFPVERAYAESRKKATAIIEAIATSEGAVMSEDWQNKVLPAMADFTPGFKTVADVQRAAGLKGLEDHPNAWPENSDLVALSHRYDDRSQRLYALENATDSGDWVEAAEHHRSLTRVALQSADIDAALNHATATMEIYERDPTFASSMKEMQPVHLLLQGQQSYWNAIVDDPSTASPEKMAQAVPALEQMISALKLQGAPAETWEGLELAKQFWSKEAEGDYKRIVSIMQDMANENGEQPKDKFKRLMSLVGQHIGDKQYLAKITADHTQIMQLFKRSSDLEQTGKPEDIIQALKVLNELESLAPTDAGSVLIDLKDIQGDRERLHCKHDSLVAINKWHEEATAGRYKEALDQIAFLESLKETAERVNFTATFAYLDEMYVETETSMWNTMFTAAMDAEAGSDHKIQLWTELLDLYNQNKFSHISPADIAPRARNAQQNKWLDLAARAHEKHELEQCVKYYDEWLEGTASAEAGGAKPPGYDRILESKEQIEIAMYNNKYAQAELDCEFEQALRYLDMLEEVVRRRERRISGPKGQKSPQDALIEQQLAKTRAGISIQLSIMNVFGPREGREAIEGQRRAMGYRARFL